MAPRPRAIIFGHGYARDLPQALRGPSQNLTPFQVRRTNFTSAPNQGYSPPVSGPLGSFWHPDLGALFFGAAVSATFHGHTQAPRQAMPHSESGGRTSPAPPPRSMATRFWAFFRWGVSAPRPSAYYFWAGMLLPLLEMCPEVPRKASPHSESGGRSSPAPPTKAIAHPSQGPWGLFGTLTLGLYFWVRLCLRPPTGTPRPLAKPLPIPSPADELRPRPPPRPKATRFGSFFCWGVSAPRPLGLYLGARTRACPKIVSASRRAGADTGVL